VAGGFARGDVLLLIAVLAAFGVADAGYLTYQWYEAADSTWCDLDSYWSCSAVRESPWASVAGIPTAVVGVAGFGILLALAGAALRGTADLGPWPTDRWILLFGILGAAVGAGLTLVEVFVIQAICILCVIGFALDLGILGLAAVLVRGSRTSRAAG